jgi:hypothetical protein
MDDLRERFAALDDVPVPDRLARRPIRPLTGPRPPSALRRGVTALVAVVLAVVSFAILVRAFRSAPPRETVDVGATTFAAHLGDPIAVGDYPNAVAVGAGAVWVSAHPADGPPYELVRLDPVTGEVVARIEVPALPTWEVGGGGHVALPDGVWVTGTVDRADGTGCCGDAIVFRVDPATNEVADRIDLGPGGGNDVWVDDTGVWVLIFDEAPEPGISVVRLDPVSLEEVARIPLPSDWAKQVFAYDGSIWVHGNREGTSEEHGVVPDVLFRIDPATNRYVERVDLPSEEFSLAVDGSSIWQRAVDGVFRVDPGGSHMRVPLEGLEEYCCDHIVSDRMGGLWVVAQRREPRRVEVVHVTADGVIDARGEAEVPETLESVAVAFDPEHRTIWLAQYKDTVTPLRVVPD